MSSRIVYHHCARYLIFILAFLNRLGLTAEDSTTRTCRAWRNQHTLIASNHISSTGKIRKGPPMPFIVSSAYRIDKLAINWQTWDDDIGFGIIISPDSWPKH